MEDINGDSENLDYKKGYLQKSYKKYNILRFLWFLYKISNFRK